MRTGRRAALLLAAVVSAASGGCTDDGIAPRTGAWQGLVTGTIHRSLVGFATFGTVASDDGDDDFLIELLADEPQPIVLIEMRSPLPGRPAVGALPVRPTPDPTAVTVTILQLEGDGGLTGSLRGQSGSVTIESSTAGRLQGEFDFVATGYLAVDGVIVPDARLEVSGAFSAMAAD